MTRFCAVFVAFALATGLAGCAHPRFEQVGEFGEKHSAILRVKLLSNVYLLRGAVPVLVDSGGVGRFEDLVAALADLELKPADIKLAILTHGHADHAGLARRLQQAGARIVAGDAEAPMLAAGHNDPLHPTSLMARVVGLFIAPEYEALKADLEVSREAGLRLAELPEGEIVEMPGHTPGSLVVFLDGGKQALVGDMLLGGYLGGDLFPSHAGEHYFQGDLDKNHRNVERVLERGVTRIYPGHGGPVERASVEEWRKGWE